TSPVASYAATGPSAGPALAVGSPGAPVAPTPRPAPPKPVAPPAGATTLPLVAGDRGALVAAVQQRLVWLGYRVRITRVMDRATLAAVRTFRIKFFLGATPSVTAAVFTRLRYLTRSRGVLPAACRVSGLVLCIDKTQKSLRFVSSGRILLTADARFGGIGHATREGVFRVFAKSRFHVSSLYHTSMPNAMFFSGGEAVHYSPYFHRDGYNGASHGCVNLRSTATASYLFDHVSIGTRVVVYH
ncbi:MAG TPA: L,D-transpeptidase family protein, partial [Candidatus Nanopelagicales bacterium]|nr:L,D-transpeptidase family protein [Candidatus Nanopelagicales bacterium]